MIEFIKKPSTTIYTNYSITVFIVWQISLLLFNTDKLNLRLVRVSQYLFTFELNIKYKLRNKNLISDALLRLLRERSFVQSLSIEIESILEKLHTIVKKSLDKKDYFTYVFVISLIKTSSEFRQRLLQTMKMNKRWADIIFNIKIDNKKASS